MKNCNNCPMYDIEKDKCKCTHTLNQKTYTIPRGSLRYGCPTEEEKENGFWIWTVENKGNNIEEKIKFIKGYQR